LALAILITLLQGLVGISFGKIVFYFLNWIRIHYFHYSCAICNEGLLISTGCDNEMGALSLSQASFLPLLVISGICWPIEGMPFYLRKIAYAMLWRTPSNLSDAFSQETGVWSSPMSTPEF
jgi:ABC-type multidrug transport system permease subunit